MSWVEPAVEVVGFVLIVLFCWFWWWPLAFLVGGVLCVLWANRPRVPRPPRRPRGPLIKVELVRR